MKTPTYKYNGTDYKVTSIDFENNEFSININGKDKFIQNNLLIKWTSRKKPVEETKTKQRLSFTTYYKVKKINNMYAQCLNAIYDSIVDTGNDPKSFLSTIKSCIKSTFEHVEKLV